MRVKSRVFDDAMSLSVDQRADLIDRLLDSLDTDVAPSIEAAWAAEAQDRLAAYRRGELST